jgi:membrane protease YdiL (CAAX protease family)
LAAAAILWARDGSDFLVPRLGLWELGEQVALGLAVGGAVVLVSRLSVSYFSWARQLSEEFRCLLGNLTGRQAFAMALMSGVGEEILFRGVLQPAVGLWLAAAIFGVLHIGPSARFWPWPIMAFWVGVLLGGCCLRPLAAWWRQRLRIRPSTS